MTDKELAPLVVQLLCESRTSFRFLEKDVLTAVISDLIATIGLAQENLKSKLRKITNYWHVNNLTYQDFISLHNILYKELIKNNRFNQDPFVTLLWLHEVVKRFFLAIIADRELHIAEQTGELKIQMAETEMMRAEVQKQNEQLFHANEMKSAFLATMSHELRTPLNSIIGFSEVLLTDRHSTLDQRRKDYVQSILDEGEHLLHLINNMLDLAKIEAGKLELYRQSISITPILNRVHHSLKQQISEKGLDFVITNKIQRNIWADETRLYQVFLNLVSNAIKFTNKGMISIYGYEDNEFAIIKITDTGIGIPSEYLEQIFETFEQIQTDQQREYRGVGLGLPITKQLIEQHGGRIWVTSNINSGSTFLFSIPLLHNSIVE